MLQPISVSSEYPKDRMRERVPGCEIQWDSGIFFKRPAEFFSDAVNFSAAVCQCL